VIIAQTPLLAPFGSFVDGSSYVMFPGVQGAYLPMRLKRKIGRKWCAAHGQRYVENTPERIDEMVQQIARRP
jgi:hypothetical protein